MSLSHEIGRYILPGDIICGINAEYGDDYERDFLSFNLDVKPGVKDNVLIDSLTGTTYLESIEGDLTNLIDSPVLLAHSISQWDLDRVLTDVIIHTALGQVVFHWIGDSTHDLEIQ